MLKILFLSAPITFLLMLEGSCFFNDPDEPKGFPVVMFEVTFFFGLVYPLLAAAIVWLCEASARLKRWSMGIGLALSLASGFLFFWNMRVTFDKASDYWLLMIFLAYSFVVTTGLVAFTGRLSIRLLGGFSNLATKLKNLGRALPN